MRTPNDTLFPFQSPLYVMTKPVGSVCNMTCNYCYYSEKHRYASPTHISDQTLENFIRQYIDCQTTDSVLFTWHGGEPLLLPISFYQKVIHLQNKYAAGRHVDNCLQTNGTLITDDYARFFHDNGWLIGVSIDGPAHLHDFYRHMHHSDAPTHSQTMHGINLLRKHEVEWNALATVNAANAKAPDDFYDFFKSIDCTYIQFTPVVERLRPDGTLASLADTNCTIAPFSVSPAEWGSFLCHVFDRWLTSDVGTRFFQLFDATLANYLGVPPGVCSMSAACGNVAVLEANGNLYSCDHFVFPEFLLGNISHHSLTELMYADAQKKFARLKQDFLPPECTACQWHFACHGECPRNRFMHTIAGRPGLNYLCQGYKTFFAHAHPYMDIMARLVSDGRDASEVANYI